MSKRRQISLILLSCTMPTNGTFEHRGQDETVEAHPADDVDIGECGVDRRTQSAVGQRNSIGAAPGPSFSLMAANTFASSAMVALC